MFFAIKIAKKSPSTNERKHRTEHSFAGMQDRRRRKRRNFIDLPE